MPIYEYEPDERACFMCDGRIGVIQSVAEAPLKLCPYCGMEVRRLVSQVQFRLEGPGVADAERRGFTTWRRVAEGKWEKVAGGGADALVASDSDIEAVKQDKSRKIVDLDNP